MNTKTTRKDGESLLIYTTTAFIIITIIFLSSILFSGCKKVDDLRKKYGNNSAGSSDNFFLRMTDAPGNYDAVNIEVIGAEVHSDVNGWVALNVKPGIYNLLDLTNGKDTLIGSGQVAVGKVSQIRLILGNNNTVMVDSLVYQLTTPSAQQSGLKLKINADLVIGVNYYMLIDFDANKSIVAAGKGKYLLKPVIRVINKVLDGSIAGVVMPLAAQPAVLAINGTDTFSTYADVATGGFLIGGLKTGSYKVVVMPKAPYGDTALLGVGVNAGAINNVGIITVK